MQSTMHHVLAAPGSYGFGGTGSCVKGAPGSAARGMGMSMGMGMDGTGGLTSDTLLQRDRDRDTTALLVPHSMTRGSSGALMAMGMRVPAAGGAAPAGSGAGSFSLMQS